MEYFDVLDKNRNFLNYIKQRGSILENNEYNQGAELWIINDNNILMTKRSLNKSHPGNWEVPGGCSQAGETTTETIIREIKEEIGINIQSNNIQYIFTHLYKNQFVDIFTSSFEINIKNTNLQSEEISDIKFISKNNFYEMIENKQIVPSVLERFVLIKEKLDLDW